MLGLYSLVLKNRSLPHMKEVAALIENDKARFFPSHIDFVTGENGEFSERRTLLDGLVEVMEDYVCPPCKPPKAPSKDEPTVHDGETWPTADGQHAAPADGKAKKGKKAKVTGYGFGKDKYAVGPEP